MGLWTRLIGFTPDELSELVLGRRVARGWLMRATVHLVTAEDFASIRPVLDIVLASRFPYYQQLPGVDRAELAAAAREVLGERPLSRADLGRALAPRWPMPRPTSSDWPSPTWYRWSSCLRAGCGGATRRRS